MSTHRARSVLELLFLAALWRVLAGCAAQQEDPCNPADLNGCVLEEVEVTGAREVDDDDTLQQIATAETSHALGGVLEGVPILGIFDTLSVEYERFDRFVLERDLARVERFYRRRGFYDAKVTAGRVTRLPEQRVRVEIVVDEGSPIVIRKVDLEWDQWHPQTAIPVMALGVDSRNELELGEPFDEDRYDGVKQTIVKGLTDLGYAYGTVKGDVAIDLTRRTADIRLKVTLGPACKFGKITIEGLGEIPESQVRAALGFEEGDRFSTAKIESAEAALADFNVFGATEFLPQRSPEGQPQDPVVPVIVRVEPAALRSVRAGVGAEAGDRVEAHVLFGWEDRNFTRLLDRFSVDIRPGLVFYPLQLGTLAEEPPFIEVLPHFRVRTQYRIPLPFEPRTVASTSGEFNLARPRNADTPEAPDENENILGYREYVARFGLERRFFKSVFLVAPSYNIQIEDPFSYNLDETPEGFTPLVISFLELFLELDMRKNVDGKRDPIHPYKGYYVATDVQVAGRFMGGDADDVRLRPEVRFYQPVSKKVVLGFRVTTGFLFAANYVDILDNPVPIDDLRADGSTDADDLARRALNTQRQKLEFRGFFSGGPSSNRGYGYNDIGPHAVLDVDGELLAFPDNIGGQTLWEASLELRFPLSGALGGAVFLDGSDVAAQLGEFRFDHPHLSLGVGLRYDTPVGPLRFDLGYRIPYLQVIGEDFVTDCIAEGSVCPALVIDEADPGDILGIPMAISIAIGEAF